MPRGNENDKKRAIVAERGGGQKRGVYQKGEGNTPIILSRENFICMFLVFFFLLDGVNRNFGCELCSHLRSNLIIHNCGSIFRVIKHSSLLLGFLSKL